MPVDARTDRLIRRTTMVGTATAAYFLLTSDYGPHPNALHPIKKAIESAQSSLQSLIFGAHKQPNQNQNDNKSAHHKPKTHDAAK